MAVLHNRGKLLDSFCVLGLFVVGIICRVWTLETFDFRMFDNSLKVLKDCCFISKQSEHKNMELMKVARGPKGERPNWFLQDASVNLVKPTEPFLSQTHPTNQGQTSFQMQNRKFMIRRLTQLYQLLLINCQPLMRDPNEII